MSSISARAMPPDPPIVMLHGASSNLEVMRQPVGDRLADKHRVILIDRPGMAGARVPTPRTPRPKFRPG